MADYKRITAITADGATRSFSFQRLQLLSASFKSHVIANGHVENEAQSQLLGTDFFRTKKVDNHIHLAQDHAGVEWRAGGGVEWESVGWGGGERANVGGTVTEYSFEGLSTGSGNVLKARNTDPCVVFFQSEHVPLIKCYSTTRDCCFLPV